MPLGQGRIRACSAPVLHRLEVSPASQQLPTPWLCFLLLLRPPCAVFALFDKLCLLSDGHVVYFGAASRATDFFADAGLAVPMNRNPGE